MSGSPKTNSNAVNNGGSGHSNSWVGDLGRSLFGFLTGGANNNSGSSETLQGTTTASGVTGTRQRPASHTAQSLQHTPVPVRRRSSKQSQGSAGTTDSFKNENKKQNGSNKTIASDRSPKPGAKNEKKPAPNRSPRPTTKQNNVKTTPKVQPKNDNAKSKVKAEPAPKQTPAGKPFKSGANKNRFQNRMGLVRSKSSLSEASLDHRRNSSSSSSRSSSARQMPPLFRSKSTLTESSLGPKEEEAPPRPLGADRSRSSMNNVYGLIKLKREAAPMRKEVVVKNDEESPPKEKNKQTVEEEESKQRKNEKPELKKGKKKKKKDRYSRDALEALENIEDAKGVWIDTPPCLKKETTTGESWIDTPSSVDSSTKEILAEVEEAVKATDVLLGVEEEVVTEVVKVTEVILPGDKKEVNDAVPVVIAEVKVTDDKELSEDVVVADVKQEEVVKIKSEVCATESVIVVEDCLVEQMEEKEPLCTNIFESEEAPQVTIAEDPPEKTEDIVIESSHSNEPEPDLTHSDTFPVLQNDCTSDCSAAEQGFISLPCSCLVDDCDKDGAAAVDNIETTDDHAETLDVESTSSSTLDPSAPNNIPPPPPLPPIKDLLGPEHQHILTTKKKLPPPSGGGEAADVDLGDFMMSKRQGKKEKVKSLLLGSEPKSRESVSPEKKGDRHSSKKKRKEKEGADEGDLKDKKTRRRKGKSRSPHPRDDKEASPPPPPLPPRRPGAEATPPPPPSHTPTPPSARRQPPTPPDLSKSDSGYSENKASPEEEEEDDMPEVDVVKPKALSVTEAFQRFDKQYGHSLVPQKEEGEEEDEQSEEEDGVRIRDERRRDATKSLSSRRSSTDSSEDGFNLNVRDLRNELKEVEEKFRKAMVANAGLDNDKAQLTYQVDLLKDSLEETEESSALVSKELREKSRDLELLKRTHAEAQRAVQLLQAQLDEQARLLSERGMVLVGHEDDDGELKQSFETRTLDDDAEQERRTRAIVSNETAALLGAAGSGPLDVRIKRLAEERDDLQDTLRRLHMDLDEEKSRNQRLERSPFTEEEADWETKKIIDDYKFKLQKSEQDVNTMQTNVARLESQVVRYQTAAETAERAEAELKSERRKLQREHRESSARVEELETANNHLETRLGKLKTAKSNLLKDL